MDTKEIIKKVRKVEIKTKKLTNNVFGGEYQSTFKGRGMTFSEVRSYEFGDDVRTIDWNVTARYNEPFVKVFEEERELTLMLMVDISGSKLFGSEDQIKKNIVTEISATLAFSAIQNNDKVGLILFTDQIELFIPPSKGRSHILRIIRELIEFKPKNSKTDISVALEFFSSIIKKKSIAFLISDFNSDDYEKPLSIVAKKHDFTGIRIFDKFEEEFPEIGFVSMYDQESKNYKLVDTSSRKIRNFFKSEYLKKRDFFEKLFKKSGAGVISCRTDEDYVKLLLGYFKNRG